MEIEVTIQADDGELPVIAQTLENLASESEIAVTRESDDGRELDLDEEERYVLAALQEEPGSALRVIHRTATEIAGSPFDDYQQEDGWNDERQNVRSILWSFEDDGIVRNDGQLWYPTDDTPTDLLE